MGVKLFYNTISCTLSISVTHVLALVTSVLTLACWHLLQCIFDLLPLNIYSWGHHPLKCFFKALANALETVAALMGDEANAFFWIIRNAFGDVEAYPGLKTEPQGRMHFFRFTNRFLQLTSASEQLLELGMELLLLKQFSAAGLFSAASDMGEWGLCTRGGTSCSKSWFDPMPEAGGERCGLRQFLKQQ